MKPCIILAILVLMTAGLTAGNRIVFYHNNYGMISEGVTIPLERGLNTFRFDDLPKEIDDNTVILSPVNQNAFTVLSQSFFKDQSNQNPYIRQQLNNPTQNYLGEYIGKDIEIVLTDGSMLKGEMLYRDSAMVGLNDKQNNKTYVVRVNEIRNFILTTIEYDFERIPNNTSLSWDIRTDKKGNYPAKLTYIASGFSWEGIYKALWDDETLTLEVFAKVSNNSGKDIEDYNVLLVAGEPKKIVQFDQRLRSASGAMAMSIGDSGYVESVGFSSEVFDEFHLFSYSEKTSLKDNEHKQLRLYDIKRVQPIVHYEYKTGTKDVNTVLTIKNNRQNSLGMVLPKGRVQLYREEGKDKSLTFIGEDFVNQTPLEEDWVVSPGKAFDVVAETIVVETRRPVRNITERDMSVTVKNRSGKARSVEVIHNIRGNWSISRNSTDYERIDANTIVFKRNMRANEELTITWTERIE